MAQYTHKTPQNHNPPNLSVYDIVYQYRTLYRCYNIRYRIRYRIISQMPARPWTGASDSMLPEWQLSQYTSSLLQGKDPKGSCSRFKTRQRDWEPAVRNQHVDVALGKDVSSSNICGSSYVIPQEEGAGIQGSWR